MKHLDGEYKLCSGCAFEKRVKLHKDLLQQEKSLRGFLRFAQFIFIFSTILFSASRLFAEQIPDFVRDNIFFEYLFFWGGVAVIGMATSYFLLLSQKRKIQEMGDKIRNSTADNRFSRLR